MMCSQQCAAALLALSILGGPSAFAHNLTTGKETLLNRHTPRVQAEAITFDCKNIKAQSYTFDLSPIAFPTTIERSELTPPTTTLTSIAINLCAPLVQDGGPADEQCPEGTQVCMKVINVKKGEADRVTHVIAAAGGDPDAHSWQAELGEHLQGAERALQLESYGARYADRRQKTEIELRCSPAAAKDSKPRMKKYDGEDGELKLVWDTPHACAVTMGNPGEGDGNNRGGNGKPPKDVDNSKQWGFFSWFFFLVVLGGIVYIAVGLWRNYNEYGVIELPNRDFWREAPYIAKDVGKHIYSTVSGQASSRAGYDPI